MQHRDRPRVRRLGRRVHSGHLPRGRLNRRRRAGRGVTQVDAFGADRDAPEGDGHRVDAGRVRQRGLPAGGQVLVDHGHAFQGGGVDRAVGGARQAGQLDDRREWRVGRQRLPGGRGELSGRDGPARHHVDHRLDRVRAGAAGQHHALPDRVVREHPVGHRVQVHARPVVQLVQGAVRVLGRAFQHPDQPRQHGLGRARLEQVGGVVKAHVEAGRQPRPGVPLGDGEVQVELGHARVDVVVDDHVEAGHARHGPGQVLHGEAHLEQRVAGRVPGRVDRLHQPVERHVLVVVGGQVGGADPGEQPPERRLGRGVRAQHQGVGEEADQLVQCRVGAPGDRAAQRDVHASAQPGQQRGQAGLQHHEQAGVGLPGQREQRPVRLGRRADLHPGAPVAGPGRPGVVTGQRQFLGQPGQPVRPVRQLPAEFAVRVGRIAQQLPLPQRVVHVLRRQVGPPRWPAGVPRRVGRGQVAGERLQRPAVAGHVVQDQHQHVVGRAGHEQVRPQRNVLGEVEAVPQHPPDLVVQFVVGHLVGAQPRPGPLRVEHVLVGHAAAVRQHGAQALVPGHHVGQGRLQRGSVEWAGHPEHDRDVVGRAGPLEPVEEPQPALGEGERNRVGPGDRAQCRPGPSGHAQAGGQAGHGGCLEQVADGQFDVEVRADPAHQAGDEQ